VSYVRLLLVRTKSTLTKESKIQTMLDTTKLKPITRLMSVLAHPLRLRILDFLDSSGEPQRVTEIVACAEISTQAIISQQLKILRDEGVVIGERRGNCVYYSIVNPSANQILTNLRTLTTN
jgi:DNA-binding transcriptional ArsR family regulator